MFIFRPQYESEQAPFRLWTRANQQIRTDWSPDTPCGWNGGGAGIKTGDMGVFLLTWAGKGLPCLLLSLLCPHSYSSLFFLLSLLLALLPTPPFLCPPPLFMGSESLMAKCSTAALEPHALEDKELAQENPWASPIKCTRNQKKGRNEHFDCGHPS